MNFVDYNLNFHLRRMKLKKLDNVTGGEKNIGLDQDWNPGPQEYRSCSVATRFPIKTRIAINYCKTRCDDRNFITFDFTTSFAIKTRIAINS